MLDSGDGARAVPRVAERTVRAVEDALAHYSLESDNVQSSLEAVRELLETDKVLVYSLQETRGADDLRVKRGLAVSMCDDWRDIFDAYLRGRGVAWGAYNAVHPEPAQRDRVLDTAQLTKLTNGRNREVEDVLYDRLGMVGHATMRILVCDGPSLLAWVGIVQPDPTTERQRQLLEALGPAFKKRLLFERMLGVAAAAAPALDAALEHVGGAAWVLAPDGHVMHANTAGRARLDADRSGVREALEHCMAGKPGERFKITALRSSRSDTTEGHIVVEAAERATTAGVPQAAARLGLTPAQTRVLERVARGVSNATIAAELKVAERTVEAHVTAILEKAQVSSRAALIVQIFR